MGTVFRWSGDHPKYEDVVKEVLDDRCIAHVVATIPSNRRVVLYFHDPTDQNTLGNQKEVVWPSLDSKEYANVGEEEHVEVDSEGNEVANEEENVEDQSNGSRRPARGRGKGVHRGAIRGGGRGKGKQPSSSSVGDENEKRKIQVAS
ncbi:hypothetical protein GBA52_004256 [Prunus armeniaca]|nr:hypothetical protein GBA52_004256 [Prunus armeniaca]